MQMHDAVDHYAEYEKSRVSLSRMLYVALRIALVWGIAFVAVTTTANYVYTPYMRHWNERIDLMQQSIAYLNDPDGLCQQPSKARLRVKIPAYDKCHICEQKLLTWPSIDAFADLMEDLQFCKGGECMWFSLNLFGYLSWIFFGIIGGASLVVVGVVILIALLLYNGLKSSYDMPTRIDPIQRALLAKAYQQQMSSSYPPPTDHTKQH